MTCPGDAPALIFMPGGRDARLAATLLSEIGQPAEICPDLDRFVGALDADAAFGILTEEAVRHADLGPLAAAVAAQPSWSALPFVVLTRHGGGPERNPEAARLSELLGNVTFLERPFHATTFASVARAARRGRERQFETRAAVERLRRSEDTLRSALSAGRLGMWQLHPETKLLTVTPMMREIFGRGEDEPFGYEDFLASLHPEDRPGVIGTVEAAIGGGGEYRAEFRHIRPDGSLRWAEATARIEREPDGAVRLVGLTADVTARKSAEASQREQTEDLERRVAARTAELEQAHARMLDEIRQRERTEGQLLQSQKMEAIGQLTGGVAHDFNNLLMAVLGNLDLLSRHVGEDARATRLIDGAIQGAQRGAALTQRLLAFARRQELKVEPRDLAELVRGSEELLRRSVGDDIELSFDLPEGLPSAQVDGTQFDLALLNLAVNARDAMPDGGRLAIAVDLAEAAGEGDLAQGAYLRLSVSDTGTGMDAATLEQATQPFFSTKELGKGTGLGLSMIHGLAQQLHGALRLSSRPGAGTRAELWLPAAEMPAAARAAPAVAATHRQGGALRILFVDDDALIAMSSVDLLEDLGHHVIQASSGPQALSVLEGDAPIDLMITDYSMPRMNGGELSRRARELRPGLPILLATGYAELPEGASLDLPRLAKPYMQRQLAEEIARLGL
ncbi:hybrid sensor histidine kinase/response regulator [Limimaricola cinnabarinus]|uniref:hybrid sensor histidine kinase/response regulator n=1 Tax=Limimaricola cinnabarinus TaxID=1125964 RepID=UPI002491CEF3|nr:hybrid sensor histidine kinase/response regulator [Limimaricola cinnabarinus]